MNENFAIFIAKSLSNGNFNQDFNFGVISGEIQNKIKEFTGLNLTNYQRIIDAEHIRHTKNSHPQDLHIFNNIEDVFNNFDYARKSITKDKRTGKNNIGIEFYRKTNTGLIEYVEFTNYHKKELRLKTTFFVEEKMIDQKLPIDLRLWTDAEYRSKLHSPQSERPITNSDGFKHLNLNDARIIIPKNNNFVKSKSNFDEVQILGLHKDYNKAFLANNSTSTQTISTIKENNMAFIKLTNEENPKLGVAVDNALNYKNKDGEIKQREPKTALIDVIQEAGQVAAMNKGTVTFNASIKGQYQTYFVSKNEKNDIILSDAKDPHNKDAKVWMNSIEKEEGEGHFYAISQNTKAGKELVENIDLKTVEREGGISSSYLKASVRLKNDDLKEEMIAKGKDHTAIVSKDAIRVVADVDLKAKSSDKEKVVNKEKVAPKEKSQGMER